MSYRRQLATLATVKELKKSYGDLRMWTFTRADHEFEKQVGIDNALRCWKRLSEWLVRNQKAVGVAIIEEHQSRVLHFHVIVPASIRIDLAAYYEYAAGWGFGRADYSSILKDDGRYACKYLSKRASKQLKGKRLVRVMNRKKWRVCGQRDVAFDSNLHEEFRAWQDQSDVVMTKRSIFGWWAVAKFLDARGCLSLLPEYLPRWLKHDFGWMAYPDDVFILQMRGIA